MGDLHSDKLLTKTTTTPDTTTGTYTAVPVGELHTCALNTDETITCWEAIPEDR
ncbi:MAG: hypothetical protein OXI96_04265 [Acidimicrobiaceae bacterium]|nr:hypothetical protein [Acidimicrobiaceae bacterium]